VVLGIFFAATVSCIDSQRCVARNLCSCLVDFLVTP